MLCWKKDLLFLCADSETAFESVGEEKEIGWLGFCNVVWCVRMLEVEL